jgi:hypothetical protein
MKYKDKYKDLDILIINAVPQSAQLIYHKETFNAMCKKLNGMYTIATTFPVDDTIKCTMNDGLMLKDIGAISTHAKCIIAIHTGPLTACFNSDTQKSVKKWILFTNEGVTHEEINALTVTNDYDINTIEKDINFEHKQ